MSNQSSFEQRPDSGRLMSAQSKRSEKSPDYWGEIAINPKDMTNVTVENGLHILKLSGWKKKSKAGATYLSLSVSRMTNNDSAAPAAKKEEHDEF